MTELTPEGRIKAYLERRKKGRGVDMEYIHSYDAGTDNVTHLSVADLEALLSRATPSPTDNAALVEVVRAMARFDGRNNNYHLKQMAKEAISAYDAALAKHKGSVVTLTDTAALVEARDDRLEWFMRLMAQVGKADSTDYPSNWIQAFCDDRGNEDDTFNVALSAGLIRSWYDGDTDHGECEITDNGKAYAAALSSRAASK